VIESIVISTYATLARHAHAGQPPLMKFKQRGVRGQE